MVSIVLTRESNTCLLSSKQVLDTILLSIRRQSFYLIFVFLFHCGAIWPQPYTGGILYHSRLTVDTPFIALEIFLFYF